MLIDIEEKKKKIEGEIDAFSEKFGSSGAVSVLSDEEIFCIPFPGSERSRSCLFLYKHPSEDSHIQTYLQILVFLPAHGQFPSGQFYAPVFS